MLFWSSGVCDLVQSFVYGRLLVPDLLPPPVSRTKVVVLSVETALGSVTFSTELWKEGHGLPSRSRAQQFFPVRTMHGSPGGCYPGVERAVGR